MEDIIIGGITYDDVAIAKFKVADTDKHAFYKYIATRDNIVILDNGNYTFSNNAKIEISHGNTLKITSPVGTTINANITDLSKSVSDPTSNDSYLNIQNKITTFSQGDKVRIEVHGNVPVNTAGTSIASVNFIKTNAVNVSSDYVMFGGPNVSTPDDYTRVCEITLASSFDVGALLFSSYFANVGTDGVIIRFKLFVNDVQWM